MAITLQDIVEQYFDYRGLVQPNADQAFSFLVSEMGELADAHVHQQAAWVRNNQKERNIPGEIGDVMMMLIVYAATQGCDPVGCMLDKMMSKDFVLPDED